MVDFMQHKTDWQTIEVLTPSELNRIGKNQSIMYGYMTDTDTALGNTTTNALGNTTSRSHYKYIDIIEPVMWYVKTGRLLVSWYIRMQCLTANANIAFRLRVRSRNNQWSPNKYDSVETERLNGFHIITGTALIKDQRIGDIVEVVMMDRCVDSGSGTTWNNYEVGVTVRDI